MIKELQMAAKLDEIHQAAQNLYGAQFAARVAEVTPQLKQRASSHNGSVLAAATAWAREKDQDARLILLVLACAVEITRSEAAQRTTAAG